MNVAIQLSPEDEWREKVAAGVFAETPTRALLAKSKQSGTAGESTKWHLVIDRITDTQVATVATILREVNGSETEIATFGDRGIRIGHEFA